MSSKPKLPPGAWDSHMHVSDPARFPLAKSAVYKPHAATLEEAQTNAQRLHLPNLVFVQPSTYGYDNSCLLDALRTVGPQHGRGVVVFDPDPAVTSEALLREWHGLGVRGARINLKSVGKTLEEAELRLLLKSYDDAIAPLGTWAVQVYVDLKVVPMVVDAARDVGLRAKLVVDHFGQPPEVKVGMTAADMDALPGWRELVREVERNERFYVKVSAPYRLTKDASYDSLGPAVKTLLAASRKRKSNGGGLVFASDWPHTRFEDRDVGSERWIGKCVEWCDGDEKAVQGLFRGGAEALWDVHRV